MAVLDDIRSGKGLKPIPDVVERKKGKWRLLTDEEMIAKDEFGFLWAKTCWMNYECTSCGELVYNALYGRGDARTNYCPNCGAKMEGSDAEPPKEET